MRETPKIFGYNWGPLSEEIKSTMTQYESGFLSETSEMFQADDPRNDGIMVFLAIFVNKFVFFSADGTEWPRFLIWVPKTGIGPVKIAELNELDFEYHEHVGNFVGAAPADRKVN